MCRDQLPERHVKNGAIPSSSLNFVGTVAVVLSHSACRRCMGWNAAIPQIREHYAAFGDRLPASLSVAVDTLEAQLN